MGRTENVQVFQDTEMLCKTNQILIESTKNSVKNQKVILEGDELPEIDKNRFEQDAELIVSKKRTYEAASAYKELKTAVHNFASASNPGGGVTRGANAQEECLCRCSNLYFCLSEPDMWNSFYMPHRQAHNPIHNDDIIFTPGIKVFKTDTSMPEKMQEKDWYDVDVITCAAPNLREEPSNGYNSGDGDKKAMISGQELRKLHEKRLERILDVAVMNGEEAVILGAFGCGAFRNQPEIVAEAAANVIQNYRKAFRVIEFAVYCGPKEDRNYQVFKEMIVR